MHVTHQETEKWVMGAKGGVGFDHPGAVALPSPPLNPTHTNAYIYPSCDYSRSKKY